MKVIYFIILSSLVFILFSCGSNQTTNNYSSNTSDTPKIIIYPITYSNVYNGDNGDIIPNYCFGTDSNGYIAAPFYSTSTVNLKNRLPTSKWSNPVYSRQGHTISSSWENLWDGNLDNMSLHDAEVIADNNSNNSVAYGGTGFWTGTKSDGTFSGDNCRDWSSATSNDNGTWGSFLSKDSQWIDNSIYSCSSSKYFLCFKYN